MAISPRQSRRSSIDIWPGFVDALSQLLMVIIFILLVFTAGQFYLGEALSGRDKALHALKQQISELANMLSLERHANADLRLGAANLSSQLSNAKAQAANEKAALDKASSTIVADQQTIANQLRHIAELNGEVVGLEAKRGKVEAKLASQQQISSSALAQVVELTKEIAALRDQLAGVAAALNLSEAKVKSQATQIADLGKKLNMALVKRVEELARYRSEFFGKLRQIIGQRPGIKIVGDRFVFQAEVLFPPGSAVLSGQAKKTLQPVFATLKQIAAKIPPDINWILLIDGYTDPNPIHNAQFNSNWELSAARAISVVQYAISQGVPRNRLGAAGFSDTQPLKPGATPADYKQDRRIELRLTEP